MIELPPIDQTTQEDVSRILTEYEDILKTRTYHHLGYPYNLDFDYSQLHHLVDYSINNLGDPFVPSNYGVHSRPFEIAVLDWFAKLWNLEQDNYWGYVTACGTEGNLHGIWLGRENMGEPKDVILVGSAACHYSVWKAGRMYNIEQAIIPTHSNDEIDYTKLEETLAQAKSRNKRVVMVVNVGSTVRGAVDDITQVITAFANSGFTPGQDYFLHLDGALFGMMLQFCDSAGSAYEQVRASSTDGALLAQQSCRQGANEVRAGSADEQVRRQANEVRAGSAYTFDNPAVSSISVSGHKFIGSPIPCGIILTRKSYIDKLSQHIAYINSRDATILGSRNGHAPLFLWYAILNKGREGFRQDTEQCMENATYLASQLTASGIPRVMLNRFSSTVVFARPQSQEFVSKWQLACQGDIAHIVVMPNVTREKIDEFIAEFILQYK